MPEHARKAIVITSRTILEVLMGVAPFAISALEFVKEERSYELIFLCLLLFVAFLYVRAMMDKIAKLEADEVLSARRIAALNMSTQNMWQDMTLVQGQRRLGYFEIDGDLGIAIYMPIKPVPPEEGERRGPLME